MSSGNDITTPANSPLEEKFASLAEKAKTANAAALDVGSDGLMSHLLLEIADQAAIEGWGTRMSDLAIERFDGASDAGKTILLHAALRSNDGDMRKHSAEGLVVERVDFRGTRVSVSELGLDLVTTPAGALVPASTRPDEHVYVTVGCEIQILVLNDDDEIATRVHERPFDSDGLFATAEMSYGMRLLRRLLWGVGMCWISNQRVAGVVYDRRKIAGNESAELLAMPDVLAGADDDGMPIGTVVVFSAPRELFEDREIIEPALGRRFPWVNLSGDSLDVVLDTSRVVDESFQIVKPRKRQIADAVDAFIG